MSWKDNVSPINTELQGICRQNALASNKCQHHLQWYYTITKITLKEKKYNISTTADVPSCMVSTSCS